MKFVLIMALAFCSPNTIAGYITVKGKVTLLNNWEGHGGHLIKVQDMSKTSSICLRNDQYILSKDNRFVKENYTLLLSARVSSLPAILSFSDSAANKCLENSPQNISHTNMTICSA